MKKLFSTTFTVFLLILLVVSINVAVSATDDIASGTCGDNLTWVLDAEGTLTISGTGPMDDYSYPFLSSGIIYPQYPWKDVADSIKQVVIQEGVTSIGETAFIVCRNLTDVTISDSVITIGTEAFARCAVLTNVTLGKNLANIGDHAFFGCDKLTEIILPDSVTEIGRGAFQGCYALEKVTLSKSLTTISPAAFCYCVSLPTISIPDGVTSIGGEAFEGCYDLYAVVLPSQLELIDYWAFGGCYSLDRVCYKGSSEDWAKITIGSIGAFGSHSEYLEKATKVFNFAGDVPVGTIIFKNWDGKIISEVTYYWGDKVFTPKKPYRPSDDLYTYTFEGWDKTVSETCVGDAIYTATFSAASTSDEPTVPSAPTEPENSKDWTNIIIAIVAVLAVGAVVIIAVTLRKKKH